VFQLISVEGSSKASQNSVFGVVQILPKCVCCLFVGLDPVDRRVKALYDYVPVQDDDLGFKKGDKMLITNEQ